MTTLDDNERARLPSLRDHLVKRAAGNRCQLCLGHLDEPEPTCAGPHTGFCYAQQAADRENPASRVRHLDAAREAGRKELVAQIIAAREDRKPVPCVTARGRVENLWTSDDPADQAHAAALCGRCAVLAACRRFGRRWANEEGVYGGQSSAVRRGGAEQEDQSADASPAALVGTGRRHAKRGAR